MSINSIDDFLNHSGSDRRGGGQTFLRGWKEKGSINVWLHTRRLPLALWQHRFPRLVVREDRDSGEATKTFYSSPLTCWEDESVLKKQWHFTPEGEREAPPDACPMCKLIECTRKMVNLGDIRWTDPVFKFAGSTDPRQDIVIHAGGLYGAFGGKLGDAEQAELRAAHIRQTEAFKENAVAKLGYVFCVVDNDNPQAGVQVAVETKLLGEKVKKVITDARRSLGDEDGNPMLKPYCIELIYDKNARSFQDMYHAVRIEKIRMTPEVEKLIRDEPPDLTQVVAKFKKDVLRSTLERYAVAKFPWDEIFDSPDPSLGEHGDDDFPPPAASAPDVGQQKAVPAAAKSAPALVDSRKKIPCDDCKAPMFEDEAVCKGCGAKYEIDPQPAPPPKVRRGKGSGDAIPFDRKR